jgi:hypothetical protein
LLVTPILAGLTLIDLAVLAAVAVVVPVALGRRWIPWTVAAASAALAFGQERGSVAAVALALPWVLLAASTLIGLVQESGPLFFWTVRDLGRVLAGAYGLAASLWLVISRAGGTPTGIHEPIVELTAVHFTYVGVGAVTLAGAAAATARGPRSRRIGRAALALTAGAPPIVAIGFVTGAALPQVGGAALLTLGVWLTAGLELARAARGRIAVGQRVLLAVSGVAIWAPMVLAVAWAAGQHWAIPILSIADMARTHGMANALGFIGAGLLALRFDRPAEEVG